MKYAEYKSRSLEGFFEMNPFPTEDEYNEEMTFIVSTYIKLKEKGMAN